MKKERENDSKKAKNKTPLMQDEKKMAILKVLIMTILGIAIIISIWIRFTKVVTFDASTALDEKASDVSELDSLLSINLDNAYPTTPEKVVNLYMQLTKATYNEDLTDEEITNLLKKEYKLLDDELAANQGSESEFVATMTNDVSSKKEQGITMANFFLDESDDTEIYQIQDRSYSSVVCTVVMKNTGNADTYIYTFTLRQDTASGKNWKILGWEVTQEDENEESLVEEICNLDLENSYPKSAADVVEYFAKITKALYNEDYTDDEFMTMSSKRTALLDDELVANQTDIDASLKSEVEEKKQAGIVIANYIVDDDDDFVYKEVGNDYCADGNCMFSMRSDSARVIYNYEFVLRRDTDGKWKIYGWEIEEE